MGVYVTCSMRKILSLLERERERERMRENERDDNNKLVFVHVNTYMDIIILV